MTTKPPKHLFLLTNTVKDVQALIDKIPQKVIAFPMSDLRGKESFPDYEPHRDKIHLYYACFNQTLDAKPGDVGFKSPHLHDLDSDILHINTCFDGTEHILLLPNGNVSVTGGVAGAFVTCALEDFYAHIWEPLFLGG